MAGPSIFLSYFETYRTEVTDHSYPPVLEVLLTVVTASIYRIPIPARSRDWQIDIRKQKLDIMVSNSLCYIQRSPGLQVSQFTLIEYVIG